MASRPPTSPRIRDRRSINDDRRPNDNLFDQLLGFWELVSYTREFETGPAYHPLGEDAVRSIVSTPPSTTGREHHARGPDGMGVGT